MTTMENYTREDQRRELYDLAVIVAADQSRQRFADELVPLLAAITCPDALGVFSDLVVAVRCSDGPEVTRALNALSAA